MIYGILGATAERNVPGYQPQYVSNGVTFNSARLVLSSLTCTDNADISFAGWFNADWDGADARFVYQIDPEGSHTFYNQLRCDYGGISFQASNSTYGTGGSLAAPPIASSVWQHIIGTIRTSPSRIVKIYVDDDSTTPSAFGTTFTPMVGNGLPLWVGSDWPGTDFYVGSMCDVSIWPGVSFLTDGDIGEATRRLFIDAGGLPVNPEVAIAALGAPAVMLTGNATDFPSNSLGTSGSLTIAEGSLTDAATSP